VKKTNVGEVSPSCYGMSFTNVGEASPKKKEKKLVREFLSNGDRKGGRDFASFVLWNVPFKDLRELNKCGRDFAIFCFVLFCFGFVA